MRGLPSPDATELIVNQNLLFSFLPFTRVLDGGKLFSFPLIIRNVPKGTLLSVASQGGIDRLGVALS